MGIAERQREYWRKNLQLIGTLASIWFLVTFCMSYFAGAFAGIGFFGWPLPFYVAAQGALIVYVLIVWYYAQATNRLDEEFKRDTEVNRE